MTQVFGRCVDESGRPITGAAVTFWPIHLNSETGESEPLPALGPLRTRDDGRFRFWVRRPEANQFGLSVWSDDFVPLGKSRIPQDLKIGSIEDLGDFSMPRGCLITITIVDSQGRRIEDSEAYSFELETVPAWGWLEPGAPFPARVVRFEAHPEGGTRVPGRLIPGTYQVSGVDNRREYPEGLLFLSPPKLVVPRGQRDMNVQFAIANPDSFPSLRGVVVDESGAPIVNAIVHALGGPHRRVVADSSGAFTIRSFPDRADETPSIRVVARGFDDVWRGAGAYRWGDDIRVVLPRSPAVTVSVVEEATSKPLADYGLWLREARGEVFQSGLRPRLVHYTGNHPDGILRIASMKRAKYFVQVIPTDRRLLPSSMVEFDVTENSKLRIELPRAATRTLRVVGFDETPLAGAEVTFLEPRPGRVVDHGTEWVQPLAAHPSDRVPHPNFALARRLDPTNGRGELVMTGPAGRNLTVNVRCTGHVPKLVHGLRLDSDDGPLVVRLSPSAAIHGRVHAPRLIRRSLSETRRRAFDLLPAVVRLRLVAVSANGRALKQRAEWLHMEDDGSFQASCVNPETFDLMVYYRERVVHTRRLTVRSGETRLVQVDLSQLEFGDLMGSVLLDGRPVAGAYVTVHSSSTQGELLGDAMNRIEPCVADRQGRFRISLIKGRYRLAMRLPDEQGYFPCDEACVVTDKKTTALVFRARSRQITFRVRASDGEPCAGIVLILGDPASSQVLMRLPGTDRAGEVRQRLSLQDRAIWIASKNQGDANSPLINVGRTGAGGSSTIWIDLPGPAQKYRGR